MRARPGDRIILAGEQVDQPTRAGEVLEARGPDGGPPYVVRWEDGHTSTMFPGPGAVLKVTDAPPAQGEEEAVAKPGLGTLREWSVRVTIFEQGDDTTATVALLADSPEALTAKGTSRRSGSDAEVTQIGDEVAVARALRRLADGLLEAAAEDIATVEGHPVTLPS